jgi:hypothetical protein
MQRSGTFTQSKHDLNSKSGAYLPSEKERSINFDLPDITLQYYYAI